MSLIDIPNDLSKGAWKIMLAVYRNYQQTDSADFDKFDQFEFSEQELLKYCQELHDKRYVFLEYDSDGKMYLYMLPKILFPHNK